MKKSILASCAVLLISGAAMAQTPATPSPAMPQPTVDAAAPLPGANSFTETQARERLEKAGYSGVNDLKKDELGIWRGSASRNGGTVLVSVDYRGNVTPL